MAKVPSDMYLAHCERKFADIDLQLQHPDYGLAANAVSIHEVKTIVTNGLSHRVERIEKILWGVAGATILTLVTVILQHLIPEI